MSTNDSHDAAATPSTESPPRRGRDARKGAHNDGTDAAPNNPPHGHVSHGPAYFLSKTDPDTLPEEGWIEELVERSRRFQRAQASEQADLDGWSE